MTNQWESIMWMPLSPSASFYPQKEYLDFQQQLKHLDAATKDLLRIETLIDFSCTSSKGREHGPEQQEGFIRTLEAVHCIVKQKLYRARRCTMEQYFSIYHNISRAQVYRLLDCHSVLKELDDFSVKPLKQRILRTLKKLASTTIARRKLWEAVLQKYGTSIQNLTSVDIQNTWEKLGNNGSAIKRYCYQ